MTHKMIDSEKGNSGDFFCFFNRIINCFHCSKVGTAKFVTDNVISKIILSILSSLVRYGDCSFNGKWYSTFVIVCLF
jgi:hypothetical protein